MECECLRDPYEILGLAPDAGAAEIKSAYRRLAKRYHPDAQSRADGANMKTRFQEVTAAYNLLKDAGARARLDRARAKRKSQAAGATPFEEASFTRRSGAFKADAQASAEKGAPDELFADLFEGLRSAGKRVFRARGEDRTYRLPVSFLEAARGAKKRVTLASGKTLDVQIPAGIEEGRQIRLRGQGEEGFGGADAGDALIAVSIEPHPHFERRGLDIHLTLPVSLPEAVLGAKIEVPTISGPVTLSIPKGSNTGTKLRLKGRGIAPEGGPAGDQYVTLELRLPEVQDEALRDFAAGWGQGLGHDPRRDDR